MLERRRRGHWSVQLTEEVGRAPVTTVTKIAAITASVELKSGHRNGNIGVGNSTTRASPFRRRLSNISGVSWRRRCRRPELRTCRIAKTRRAAAQCGVGLRPGTSKAAKADRTRDAITQALVTELARCPTGRTIWPSHRSSNRPQWRSTNLTWSIRSRRSFEPRSNITSTFTPAFAPPLGGCRSSSSCCRCKPGSRASSRASGSPTSGSPASITGVEATLGS
jgi:hypothetical protein